MKVRRYQKIDTAKMSRSELKAYKKRLAYVRNYTRLKREWQKKIISGVLSPKFTLDMYRRAKAQGKPIESLLTQIEKVKEIKVRSPKLDTSKIERLLKELRRNEEAHEELKEQIYSLSAG